MPGSCEQCGYEYINACSHFCSICRRCFDYCTCDTDGMIDHAELAHTVERETVDLDNKVRSLDSVFGRVTGIG